ncbi:MAG TPA: cytochrome d ubiquinol oxidase subunit II, partial [Acidimicrobiales bacterium]|nr:cytochrome d ubiquinol oxidase subunit II [Acidimicrobiales bacterium]
MTVDVIAAVLWLVVTAYALTGGADFGGGVWDLFAGGAEGGRRARSMIDRSIAPVWEANHVWLVVALVVLWTAFPRAFGPLMSTLFVPLSAAAFGIVLRGAGFALRQEARTVRHQQAAGGAFALSSLITPFFMGAAAAAVVTGRVPATGTGSRLGSWTTPTALTIGFLSIAAFAYLAAVYLTADSRRLDPGLTGYFVRRALASGVLTGALAGAVLYEISGSAPRTMGRLTSGAGLPLFALSIALGVGVVAGLALGRRQVVRYGAAGAFAALLWGGAVAQWPYLLPPHLTVHAAVAPGATIDAELVVVGAIVVLVAPSFALLYRLTQRGVLGEHESGAGLLA